METKDGKSMLQETWHGGVDFHEEDKLVMACLLLFQRQDIWVWPGRNDNRTTTLCSPQGLEIAVLVLQTRL